VAASADAFARRFIYALEVSDYDTIDTLFPSNESRERVVKFRENLLGDGHVTLVDRLSLESKAAEGERPAFRLASYRVETSREHRAGTFIFYLSDEAGSWTCRGVEASMNIW